MIGSREISKIYDVVTNISDNTECPVTTEEVSLRTEICMPSRNNTIILSFSRNMPVLCFRSLRNMRTRHSDNNRRHRIGRMKIMSMEGKGESDRYR